MHNENIYYIWSLNNSVIKSVSTLARMKLITDSLMQYLLVSWVVLARRKNLPFILMPSGQYCLGGIHIAGLLYIPYKLPDTTQFNI